MYFTQNDVYFTQKYVMHLGSNIERICKLKGIKQRELARLLKTNQQEISRIQSKETIDDEMLEKIAKAIGFSVEVIKSFSEEALINSINQQVGIALNLNPLEKIIELYEKQLKEKDKLFKILTIQNAAYQKRNTQLEKEIVELKRKIK